MKDHPIIDVNVSEIELAPWNYKEDDDVKSIKLQNTMEREGYIHKIALAHRAEEPDNNKYEVIDGNHRVMAFRTIGVESVQAIYVGRISMHQRERIGITLNELKFESDPIRLAELMTELSKEYSIDDLTLTMPYNQSQIEDMSKLLEFDWGEKDKAISLQEESGNSEPTDSEWISFKFGAVEGKIPEVVYSKFGEALSMFKKNGVENLVNQIEYMSVAVINELQGAAQEPEKETE